MVVAVGDNYDNAMMVNTETEGRNKVLSPFCVSPSAGLVSRSWRGWGTWPRRASPTSAPCAALPWRPDTWRPSPAPSRVSMATGRRKLGLTVLSSLSLWYIPDRNLSPFSVLDLTFTERRGLRNHPYFRLHVHNWFSFHTTSVKIHDCVDQGNCTYSLKMACLC